MAFTPIVSTTVTGQTVIAGTQSIVNGGVTNITTINAGGMQRVSSGGRANSTTVNDGGEQDIFAGGAASSTVVSTGGLEVVSSGGADINGKICDGGTQTVSAGATASNTVISATYDYARQSVFGIAVSASLDGGWARQYISSGGIGLGTIINDGYQMVYSGGVTSASVLGC